MPNIKVLPDARPNIDADKLKEALNKQPYSGDIAKYKLVVVGIRGFFQQMGKAGANDRSVYDDAIILYIPGEVKCLPFNGNTDPSRVRKGYGFGQTKGMAVLNTGLWPVYKFDRHNGSSPHDAICQRLGTVTVTRDGDPSYPDTGNFGINIHRGGFNTTSSLGCQTIHPDQWDEFYSAAKGAAQKLWQNNWKMETVAYVLLDYNDYIQ